MSLVERLAALDTAMVSDVLDEAGLPDQALSPWFSPLSEATRMCGIASCAYGRPVVNTRQPAIPRMPVYAMEDAMKPGHVLMLDAGAAAVGAMAGAFLAASMQARGAAGMVIDGAVRDRAELRAMGLPIFSRGSSPVNAARRWDLLAVDLPISLPGGNGSPVAVRPGDLVLGDEDGIVVVPAWAAEQIIEDAETLQRIEHAIRAEMEAGATREEAFGRHPRFGHIRPVFRKQSARQGS